MKIHTVITLRSNQCVYRFDEDFAPISSEFTVNIHTSGSQMHPAVAAHPNGTFVVVWSSESQDGDGYGVFFQRYSDTEIPEFSNIALLMVSLVVVFAVARRRRLRDHPYIDKET